MQNNPLFHRTRFKLAGAYASVMSCILGVCGFGLYQVVVHDYQESIDQGLESVAWAVHDSVKPLLAHPAAWQQMTKQLSLTLCTPGKPCQVQASDIDPLAQAASPVNYYLRLLNTQNQLIAVGGINFDAIPQTPGDTYLKTITSDSGIRFRQISLPLDYQDSRWGYIQIGRSLIDFDRHLHSLRWALILGLPVVIGLVAWSSWWLAGLAMRPIYASYGQMQQFTSDAAHEFRTPLTAMRSTIEAFQQTHLPQEDVLPHPLLEARRVLEVLQRQSIRLSQLVNDLLLLAKIERKELADYSQPCYLSEIIHDLVEELAFLAVKAGIKLHMTLPEQATTINLPQDFAQSELIVLGNETQLYRLISNLIMNAIQATPAGGTVTVELSRTDQKAMIQVVDTGIGIDANDLPHIFDRFYRIHPDRSRHTGGSGLGLAIAWAIVQAHQGTIQAHSIPGQGSRFIVRLPLD